MTLSEVIRFSLSSARSAEFTNLRHLVASYGKVQEQFFGKSIPTPGGSLPIRKDEVCWIIHWDEKLDVDAYSSFKPQLDNLAEDGDVKSLLFEFADTQKQELNKAFESPICEFAIINLVRDAPMEDLEFKKSMKKTFTDCYGVPGFNGGNWGYAVNSNDTSGNIFQSRRGNWLADRDRRLACYFLGWESIEHHRAFIQTALFDEEIDKLKPWFGPGSGAWYTAFQKHK